LGKISIVLKNPGKILKNGFSSSGILPEKCVPQYVNIIAHFTNECYDFKVEKNKNVGLARNIR